MGFISDKTELFGEISATKALFDNFPELKKTFNSYESVKSKKGNVIPLLLDLLKETLGSDIQKQFNEFIKKTDKIENKIKEVIVKEILKKAKGTNFSLSNISNPVLNTNIKNIDVSNTLKMNPDTSLGKFYYGKAAPAAPQLPNDPSIQVAAQPGGDFQKFLFDTKRVGSGNWKNIMDVEWVSDNLKLNINPQYLANKSLENLLVDFLDSVTILDLSQIVSSSLDITFGAVSSLTDAGQDWLEDRLKLKTLCEKVIEKESLSSGSNPITYDNSFFEFSKEEKDSIRYQTDNISSGNNLAELGCGRVPRSVDFNDFENTFDSLQNVKPSLVKETLTSSIDNIIDKSVGTLSEENENTAKQNIFQQLFENLVSIIMSQTIKPFNVILQQMGESLLNTAGIDPNSPITPPSLGIGAPGIDIDTTSLNKSGVEDYFTKFRSLNVCLIKEAIYPIIVEFLFDVIKKEVKILVAAKIALITEDQLKNYKTQIDSAREILKNVNNILSFINNS